MFVYSCKGAKIYPNSNALNWNVNKIYIFFLSNFDAVFFSTSVDSLPGFVFLVKLIQEEALLTFCTFIFYKKNYIFVYTRCFCYHLLLLKLNKKINLELLYFLSSTLFYPSHFCELCPFIIGKILWLSFHCY